MVEVKVYKLLKEELEEERYSITPISIWSASNPIITKSNSTLTNGVRSVNYSTSLEIVQSPINDLVEKYQIDIGDKIEVNGKKYTIKNKQMSFMNFNQKGKRKYQFSL
jgi:hypothetical protein